MKRGELVRVALPGDYGKPRPAVVIQADTYSELPSVTVLPITSDLRPVPQFRVTIEPDGSNRLNVRSQVMVDKAHTVAAAKVSKAFGRLAPDDMAAVSQALILFFGLASSPISSDAGGKS